MGKLTNKIAVITGGAGGIGLATGKVLAEDGATVILTDRVAQEVLDKCAKEVGTGAIGIQVDVTKKDDLARLSDEIRKRFGRIDVYYANAGVIKLAPLDQVTEDIFDMHIAVNMKAVLFGVQAALPLMKPGSSIVMTCSCMAHMGAPAHGVYSATKAAVRSFARTWALDLKDRQIRVNVVSPGGTDTPMLKESGISPETHPDALAAFLPMVPSGRLARPSEIGRAVAFLASDDSAYMNGAEIAVDGGVAQI